MFTFIIGVFLILLSVNFAKDGILVMKGTLYDKRGKPLWVYQMLGGEVLVSKDRNQALMITFMVSFLSFLLGCVIVIPRLLSVFHD